MIPNTKLDEEILRLLKERESLNSQDLLKEFNVTMQVLYAAINSLQIHKYVDIQNHSINKFILTKEGQQYSVEGMPETLLYEKASKEGVSRADVEKQLGPVYKIALANCMKKKLVTIKDDKVFKNVEEYKDTQKQKLVMVGNGDTEKLTKEDIAALKARKLIEEKPFKWYVVTKGPEYKENRVKQEPELTSEMLANKSWKQTAFRRFNLEAKGEEASNGNLHPLMKTRQQFREILLQLGFEEMKTNRYVESSFWNFDALFQPQFHPARDAHDTFFITDPKNAKMEDEVYWNNVRAIHEKGGYGSIGYDCQWSDKEASKNILRTHTTAVSSRTLYEVAKSGDFRPRKFFSIDRVFRNETLDMTHLAEFHQIEGFVIDRNLGLPHLIGIITEFYKKIGIEKIWLKPTYNPYTEPSMEVYGYHPVLKKKVEIGNSGIFRPEMLRPMGFPEDMNVIAWGLGLQRPTMIQYNISNIKELFGSGVSIRKLRENGVCCLSK